MTATELQSLTTADAVPGSLEELWMPFTANRAFKRAPRLLVSARGMYYTSADGRAILDGAAGLWCVNAGHAREPIVQAIQQGAATLDFAPIFQMGHPLSFVLAHELAALFPGDIDRVFFANSGSEAVDSALKIVLAYWLARGQPQRVRFVGRQRGYHGVGFGGISARPSPRSSCRTWITCRTRTASRRISSRADNPRTASSWRMRSRKSCASAGRRRSPR